MAYLLSFVRRFSSSTRAAQGRVVRIENEIVDIHYESGHLPNLKNVLQIGELDTSRLVEVTRHLQEENVARCVAIQSPSLM
jgi:F0F1-type ATP synthase beta subunit